MFGLYKSVLISDIKTKSTLDASTVLKTAPIFPGFSGDSKIKIIGFFFLNLIEFKSWFLKSEIAIKFDVDYL